MKVVLISGATPLPPELREIIARGSTELVEFAAGDTSASAAQDADRIVLWAGGGDEAVRGMAGRCAEAVDRRADTLVFVSEAGGAPPSGFTANELFEWPADEDRLKMAFVTGA
jgi:hypothetical protein